MPASMETLSVTAGEAGTDEGLKTVQGHAADARDGMPRAISAPMARIAEFILSAGHRRHLLLVRVLNGASVYADAWPASAVLFPFVNSAQRASRTAWPRPGTRSGMPPSFAMPPIVGGWPPAFFSPSTVIVRMVPEPDSAA